LHPPRRHRSGLEGPLRVTVGTPAWLPFHSALAPPPASPTSPQQQRDGGRTDAAGPPDIDQSSTQPRRRPGLARQAVCPAAASCQAYP
jgi:hypothetical protein